MKPTNSVARRWEHAARLVRWGSLVLAIGGVIFFAAAVGPLTGSDGDRSTWRSSSDHTRSLRPATRPALVEQISDRLVRQPLIPKPAVVAERVGSSPTSAPSAARAAPAIEVVATYTGEDAAARAFVRRGGAPDLLVWSAGSVEGIYTVTEIGDGWVALESHEARHMLSVPRRLP